MGVSADSDGFRRWQEVAGDLAAPPADVRIVTSDGRSLAAHSSVLASASPVLEAVLDRPRKSRCSAERTVLILGAPHDAVLAFVRFLYSSSSAAVVPSSTEAEAAVAAHGAALLVLAHAYRVPWLKRVCEAAVAARLTAAEAVDALKLARMCDAPRLRQRCLRLVAADFDAVRRSDGWRFAQMHDPVLELEILQFLEDEDERKKRWRRERANRETYQTLNEAMECLKQIFTGGNSKDDRSTTPPPTLRKLQLLIHHYANCEKKFTPGGCTHCKRTRGLFRLHSALCDQPSSCCKVPLCKHFKLKREGGEKESSTWRILVKKVITARVMASLANRKRPELVEKSWLRYQGRR